MSTLLANETVEATNYSGTTRTMTYSEEYAYIVQQLNEIRRTWPDCHTTDAVCEALIDRREAIKVYLIAMAGQPAVR